MDKESNNQETPRKFEIAFACFGTGVAANIAFVIIAFIFASNPAHLIEIYFEKYIFILVTALIFLVFWRFYAKKLKRSNALW